MSNLLFRGHSNANFPLITTLERNTSQDVSFSGYYGLISRVQDQIEEFTGKRWHLPTREEFHKQAADSDGYVTKKWGHDAYSYLIYLRHHGFPSPLLDWSKSPYVAAYFAFRSPVSPKEDKVAIYVFCEYWEGGKTWSGNEARITGWGPYSKRHRRHFLQQGSYTICTLFKNKEWYFVSHDEVLCRNKSNQDICWKFVIPWNERTKVLKILDDYNLNAFSLFDSEESLMETMALRELNFRLS